MPTAADSLQAAIDYGRSLENRLAILKGDLRIARRDSLLNAEIYALELADKDRQIAAWKERAPRWFEEPAFVAGITAIIVSFAVLQAVQISL